MSLSAIKIYCWIYSTTQSERILFIIFNIVKEFHFEGEKIMITETTLNEG